MRKINDITIVSLSSGTLGESFVSHELEIGTRCIIPLGINAAVDVSKQEIVFTGGN